MFCDSSFHILPLSLFLSHFALLSQLPQSRKDMVERTVNSGRPAHPSEVAETIVWLGVTSPLYVNGSTIDVNDSSYPR